LDVELGCKTSCLAVDEDRGSSGKVGCDIVITEEAIDAGRPVSSQLPNRAKNDYSQGGYISERSTYCPLSAASKKGDAKNNISLCALRSDGVTTVVIYG
jgi:hypothetical protein